MNVTASKKALYCRTEYIFIFITCIVQVEFSQPQATEKHFRFITVKVKACWLNMAETL